MQWNERIVIDSAALTGKPVIRGTRLAVDFIVGLLAQDWTQADTGLPATGPSMEGIDSALKSKRALLRVVLNSEPRQSALN